jgi:hypothetical protein
MKPIISLIIMSAVFFSPDEEDDDAVAGRGGYN